MASVALIADRGFVAPVHSPGAPELHIRAIGSLPRGLIHDD
jgi:hypothetical protein